MKKSLKFALLVPCYNAESYIDAFLDNIAKLNRPFDEVLFYDDASTDNTYRLLKQKGCHVIKGEVNRGPGFARNQLAQSSQCEWFHFHDIDDGLNSDYLVKTAGMAEKNQFDVVLCNVNWYDAQTKALALSWEYSNTGINENPVTYTISHPIGGINGLYRKSKFIQTGGFNTDIRIWEDADLHVKLAAQKARFYIIEEVLSYSLRYPASASTDQSLSWLTRLNLLQNYFEIFTDEATRMETGKQAQVAAGSLIIYRQFSAAKKAFQLSELCKVKVPYNNSRIWGYIKWGTPSSLRISLRLLQLKLAFRKST
ncbi:glycosyltransferase family 2 protein [Mucilaginibacter sp.]|uniref:glycosyltransferase family 2 protein n=1 Tax=Mucilaginibacter sp. TaxID=1882438 RepID=UPI0025FA13A3|nr:glycosyltransferase family 2 protein [Mucilaginibacter sp.]